MEKVGEHFMALAKYSISFVLIENTQKPKLCVHLKKICIQEKLQRNFYKKKDKIWPLFVTLGTVQKLHK